MLTGAAYVCLFSIMAALAAAQAVARFAGRKFGLDGP